MPWRAIMSIKLVAWPVVVVGYAKVVNSRCHAVRDCAISEIRQLYHRVID